MPYWVFWMYYRTYSNMRRPRMSATHKTEIIKVSAALKKNTTLILNDVEEASPAMQVLDLDQI